MKLSEIIQEKHNIDYSQEIANLVILGEKLNDKKYLSKDDRGLIQLAFEVVRLGEV